MRALLLDLDDTLLDTRAGTRRALADFHASHGAAMGAGLAEALRRWDLGIKLHFPRYVAGEISFQDQRRGRVRELFARPDLADAEADALFAVYLAHAERHFLLFDDVLPFLERVAGLPIAVVTNGHQEVQTAKLRATGLSSRIRAAVVSEGCGYRKPRKEIFLLACEALGVAPEDCLMVGDNYEADVLGGRGAGMQALLIDRFGDRPHTEGGEVPILTELHGVLSHLGLGYAGLVRD